MKKWLKRLGLAVAAALLVAQAVPLARSNPPERDFPAAPAAVRALLQRACNDCHSHETRWPWYSSVAPMSFLVARDVKEGRKELNFSRWDSYDPRRQERKKKDIAKEVGKGAMPPWFYLPLHPEARLSAEERELIVRWAKRS